MNVKFITGEGKLVIKYTAEEGRLSVSEFKSKLADFVLKKFPCCSFEFMHGCGKRTVFVRLSERTKKP